MEGQPVNYWPRWINAIKKRTATLSLAQMGAYDRLLDHYYAEEKPLPSDMVDLYRICGAQTKLEREAVQSVLAKFFELQADGYRNERADEEIVIGLKKIEAAQENGKKGGRPKGSNKKPTGIPSRNPAANPAQTQSESSPSPSINTNTLIPPSDDLPPPAYAHVPTHVPACEAQGQVPQPEEAPAPPDPPAPAPPVAAPPPAPLAQGTPYGAITRRLMDRGIGRANPGHIEFRQLVDAGASFEEFDAYVPKALAADDPWSYLITTVRNERKRAKFQAAQLHQGPMPARQQIAQPQSFRQQDREANMRRWEEATGRVHPDREQQHRGHDPRPFDHNVIDMESPAPPALEHDHD